MRNSNAKDVVVSARKKAIVVKSTIHIARYKPKFRRRVSETAENPKAGCLCLLICGSFLPNRLVNGHIEAIAASIERTRVGIQSAVISAMKYASHLICAWQASRVLLVADSIGSFPKRQYPVPPANIRETAVVCLFGKGTTAVNPYFEV